MISIPLANTSRQLQILYQKTHPLKRAMLYLIYMVKQKKKRNKTYSGAAAATRPAVTRVVAVNRGKVGQWWYDNKRKVRIGGIAAAISFAVFLIIVGIVGLLV